jgi:hypothetical protein
MLGHRKLPHAPRIGRRWGILFLAALTASCGGAALLLSTGPAAPSAAEATSSGAIPTAVAQFAAASGVTHLGRLGPTSSSRLGLFSGRNAAGEQVVAVGLSSGFGPFVPLKNALRDSDLVAYSGDSGSTMSSVDSREVVGLVSPSVSRVEVVLQDGSTRGVQLVGQGFAYSAATPEPFPVRVVAYNSAGATVGSKDFLEPSPPGN